ncbi:hypothetical protein F2Q68_00040548 [Brassica cretica]|uniref:Uncharacterized protein n=1 Tax=Brassica cretica TaxID=69181 RepID=A0A8S9MME0_BRACR|nr:hypothetical protein F2Q68_00040548 [Brassica cretica]
MKESKVINRKRAKREQRGLISEFAFEREQQRDETWVLRPRARGLCYGNLAEDARFRDRRSFLAYGRGDLGAGRPRPGARSYAHFTEEWSFCLARGSCRGDEGLSIDVAALVSIDSDTRMWPEHIL